MKDTLTTLSARIPALSVASDHKMVILLIPKFRIDSTLENIIPSLKKLGIQNAFDPSVANFSLLRYFLNYGKNI